jgi:hypothetical protein
MCGREATVSDARKLAKRVVCNECWQTPEVIWCPQCDKTFSYTGYLRGAFVGDRAGLHAAVLVTHYRHDHVRSHDRACRNPYYRNSIPNYDYDEYKLNVNNRAKRQLIRAIAKRDKQGNYPETAPIKPYEFIKAFGRLKETDKRTEELITSVMAKLRTTR